MKNLLILHGSFGTPFKNWYQYVGEKAKSKGYLVNIPQLEHIDKLDLEETYDFLLTKHYINNDTTIIGHSSGATYILGILQRLPKNLVIQKSILVAGFVDAELTEELFRAVSKEHYYKLFPPKWDWKKIKNNCTSFVYFHSPDDPYVQIRHSEFLKEKLGGDLIILPGSRHFSVNSGGDRFTEFPEIIPYI